MRSALAVADVLPTSGHLRGGISLLGEPESSALVDWESGPAACRFERTDAIRTPLPSARSSWGAVDRTIIDACQRGDHAAFRELVEACQDRVHSLTRHFCGSNAAVKDIAQEVFLAVFQGIGQFRHEARFETWLYRIVINACLKEQRRRRILLPLVDEVQLPAERPDQSREAGLVRREVASEVRAAVARLRPKLRRPLLMKHVGGLSYDEIGAALGCSTGTVASRLNRARTALAGTLAHLRGAAAGD